MKTFFSTFSATKKGFTLVELMIVVSILGLLFVAMSSFDAGARINQERVTRMANTIADEIRDARHNAMVGFGVKDGNDLVGIYSRNISITTNDIKIWYKKNETDSLTALKHFSKNPNGFFDGDKKFTIKNIEVSDKVFSGNYMKLQQDNTTMFDVADLELSFPSSGLPTARVEKRANGNSFDQNYTIRTYRITVEYNWFERYIFGDVLSGSVEIKTESN